MLERCDWFRSRFPRRNPLRWLPHRHRHNTGQPLPENPTRVGDFVRIHQRYRIPANSVCRESRQRAHNHWGRDRREGICFWVAKGHPVPQSDHHQQARMRNKGSVLHEDPSGGAETVTLIRVAPPQLACPCVVTENLALQIADIDGDGHEF